MRDSALSNTLTLEAILSNLLPTYIAHVWLFEVGIIRRNSSRTLGLLLLAADPRPDWPRDDAEHPGGATLTVTPSWAAIAC